MRYVSTRGVSPDLGFADVLLEGLATDGGLFVPAEWPQLPDTIAEAYAGAATQIMAPFVAGQIDGGPEAFGAMVADAYATFEHPDVVPVSDLGDGLFLAELYWGPTLAFKDVALQLLGRLFDAELARRGERVTIVGATSGDTGSAAIEACRDRDHIDIFILHPEGRTSEVQRRQMTTVDAANVHNIAVQGSFDDCQDIVKALFADEAFRRTHRLSAVNSINWARVMAQTVYYVTAARAVNRRLGRPVDAPVSYCVPTGNFGNVFAGYGAMRMGLAVDQLLIASNENDILTRLFTTGTMDMHEVAPTLSPSMDIMVSSNLERLLFEMGGRDGAALADLMLHFRSERTVTVPLDQLGWLREHFDAGRFTDPECLALMRRYHERSGVLLDPHTAVGVGVAERLRRSTGQGEDATPMICLGTAHPAKFPDAVERATGIRPPLPPRLADLYDRTERYEVLPADVELVVGHIESSVG